MNTAIAYRGTLKTNHGEASIFGRTIEGGLLLSFRPAAADDKLRSVYHLGGPCFSVLTYWTYCTTCQDRTQHIKFGDRLECQEHSENAT